MWAVRTVRAAAGPAVLVSTATRAAHSVASPSTVTKSASSLRALPATYPSRYAPVVTAVDTLPWRRLLASTADSNQSTDLDGVHLADRCVAKMQDVNSKRVARGEPAQALRLLVDSGGCSGFAYQFSLVDGPEDDSDIVFEREGVKLIVDDVSYEFVEGATVDYTMELIKRAFVVSHNPKAEQGCGCGISFSLKEE